MPRALRLILVAASALVLGGACSRTQTPSPEVHDSRADAPPAEPTPAAFSAAEAALAELDAGIAARRVDLAAVGVDLSSPELVQRALAAMVALDQFVRSFQPRPALTGVQRFYFNRHAGKRYVDVDQANALAVQAILDRHGWPTISGFGERASGDAWLLVQHADHDVTFQKRALADLEQLVALGEVSAQNVAYLWDRVAANEGRPQRYGTQGRCTGPSSWEPLPIEDSDQVDQRRAEVGLLPLADYSASMVTLCADQGP